MPDDGPALPDLDDLAADLARLEAGGASGDTASNMVVPPSQPPVPDMNFGLGGDFNQINSSSMGMGGMGMGGMGMGGVP